MQGSPLSPPRLALRPPGLDDWEHLGDVAWARVLAGRATGTFRPRWLASALTRELAPARLRVVRPVGLQPGNWRGAPRLRRPAAVRLTTSA